mgnify:CR=1 FL=1
MDFRTDKLLHGGDYNPEQWLKRPDILEKDIDMLEESGCNILQARDAVMLQITVIQKNFFKQL